MFYSKTFVRLPPSLMIKNLIARVQRHISVGGKSNGVTDISRVCLLNLCSGQMSFLIKVWQTFHVSFDPIVTLRSEEGDGSEDVAEIVNSRSFILNSRPLALSNVGKPS